MSPTLKQLRYLVAVADSLSFSKAAAQCCVSQPTLSAAMAELEAQLGLVLFERSRRHVRPTDNGADLANRARRILGEVSGFIEAADRLRNAPAGPLKLGVIPTIAPYLLPRLLTVMRESYPDIRLQLREEKTGTLLEDLAAGRCDLLVLALPYDAPQTEQAVFLDDPFWAACPPGHALEFAQQVSPEALDPTELLLLEDGHCLRDHALDACGLRTAPDQRDDVQGTSLPTLIHMVAEGWGITLLPDMAVKDRFIDGFSVVTRPMAEGTPVRQIGLVWRATSGHGGLYREMADTLKKDLNVTG
ncbi:MAG: LysR substrate-binding domain-containing protein [Rhodospirillaceae bacterium]